MKKNLGLVRFNDLDYAAINRDYQIHTNWTDGENSAEEIITQAEKMKLNAIAFTEHIRKESGYFEKFYQEIAALRNKTDLQILIGAETKVMNLKGELDISSDDFNKAEIVLGSVHRLPKNEELIHPKELSPEELFRMEFEYSLAMINTGQIDVLAHPAGLSMRFHGEFPKDFFEELIRQIAKSEIAFEMNSKYLNERMRPTVIEFCKKFNPVVSIGSDVHDKKELGNSRKMIEELLCLTV